MKLNIVNWFKENVHPELDRKEKINTELLKDIEIIIKHEYLHCKFYSIIGLDIELCIYLKKGDDNELGLIVGTEGSCKLINKEGYSLSFENNSISLNHYSYSKIDGKVISDTNLEFIKEFLKSVREFWKEKYSKFLVRPKLRPIINFNNLSGFKNPNVRFMNLK